MNENKFKLARTSLAITTVLTLFVAGFEVLMAASSYRPDMNIFDIATYATANVNVYCLILILLNLSLLPFAVLLYHQSGISLKKELAEKKTLVRDILFGLAALALTLVLALAYSFVYTAGRSELAFTDTDTSVGTTIMKIISLVFVSGICKEIYFRGFAKSLVGSVLGETKALLLVNIMFAMLDWYNFGFSFFAGLIWIFSYKRSGHLISSIIPHAGVNLAGIIYLIVMC